MKLSQLRFTLLLAALLVAGTAAAQTETQVCPTDQAVCVVDNGQVLNRVINGDTTATGARAREDRIYQLARDAVYLYDANVRNSGYHLRVFGAEGDGALPQVYATVNQSSGNVPGDWIRQEGDVTFRDFALSGIIEDPVLNPDGLTIIPAGVVRVEQPGFTLTIDGVVWSNTRNRFVRAQSALRALFLTNSIWVNSGYNGPNGGNLGVGKAIDLRDGSIDSLVVRNNTFANYTDRVIRHRGSTGPIRTMIFDHNTIINSFSYHGLFALGQVGDKIQITNNLLVDPFVAGGDTSDVERQAEFDESGEVYANGKPEMFWVFTEPNGDAEFVIDNNVYVISPEVEQFYQDFGDGMGDDGNPDNGTDGDNDILDEGTKLTDYILDRIDTDASAFVEGDFELANRPASMVNLGTWYRTDTGRTKATETFDPETDDYDRRTLSYYLETGDFDASYPTTVPAYTAADGGCPVGDLNWFPSEFDRCSNVAVAIEEEPGLVRDGVRLFPSAPNPTRGEAMLTYSLAKPAEVEVTIVNMLGQTVATLTKGHMQTAGTHTLHWDGAGSNGPLANGLYIVRLQADDVVATSRMVVVR